ncbi:prepilin-type N-terminal cleavage/methylation domain-containing protein [Paenibacillaceae bacterium WGS1546]|uniref:prepilin-type N-terminal cleavage/methylation domain-containing protein n=1 Tax=Cohnella sp. WGS1546 TaxID=3366810 RepID=UPI00372D4D40
MNATFFQEVENNDRGEMKMEAVLASKVEKKGILRDEKGLTLIELLAVIVILAIIAAIAIPSIGGIINKTKKQSHRANAQLIIDSARYAVTTENYPLLNQTPTSVPDVPGGEDGEAGEVLALDLDLLVAEGYLENIPKDPENSTETYDGEDSFVNVYKITATGKYRYEVVLVKYNGDFAFTNEAVLEELVSSDPVN